ncbi:Transcriptional regulator, AraC family protein [Sandaracinus amylolyticus]|uniref:Transcriptional regulator, AraC family protein n=1 Tax=Sandaracinus amylolyticus TaxID=927083 RepID=A0A0F6YHX6_9BACT|nr:Transcriptional regulator, AraC family protein [Sandaracinus amylolyticus]
MRFVARKPSPALAPYVARLWCYESGALTHTRERIVPTGGMQLLVNLHEDELRWWDGAGLDRAHRMHGAGMQGIYDRPFAIDTIEQRAIAGVSFAPGGAWAFCGVPASALARDHVPLDALWARDGATLRERLLEAYARGEVLRELERVLLARLSIDRLGRDLDVHGAVRALHDGMTVRALTDALGSSEKRFVRAFVARVGVTPKRYARVLRFQRVLARVAELERVEWARIAAECGYYDQSHLVHEFRELSGLTPSAYVPRLPEEPNHVVLG